VCDLESRTSCVVLWPMPSPCLYLSGGLGILAYPSIEVIYGMEDN